MNSESDAKKKHGQANINSDASNPPTIASAVDSSVEEPETKKPKDNSGQDVELVLENMKLALRWLCAHWPFKARAEVWAAWGTWAAVIAASIYAAIAALTYGEMRTQTKQIARQFQAQQRAWVGNGEIKVKDSIGSSFSC